MVALAAGVLFLALPVSNPGVQDCGAPAAYAMTGRGNTRLLRPTDPAAVDEFERLRAQRPCSELVARRMQLGTWSIGAFIVLAAVGATLGLVDDRLSFRRAPRFERLLRERPADAPGAIWDEPVVPREDIGRKLPDVEASDVEALAVWSVVTVCVLLIVSGIGDTIDAIAAVSVLLVILAVLLAVGARVVAGGQLMSTEARWLERGGRLDRALRVMVACDFAGRLRPAFGAVGIQAHALVRRGVDRERALIDLGATALIAALVHVALGGVFLLLTLIIRPGGGSWPPYELLLALTILAMAVAGVTMLPARLHRLPCTLNRQTGDRLIERWKQAPTEVLWTAVLAGALPLLHGFVLTAGVAAFGDDVPVVSILLVTVIGLAFGAFAPTPEGLLAADVVIVVGLTLSGVGVVAAVAATLLWRIVMTWLPLLPGYLVARRLVADGTL